MNVIRKATLLVALTTTIAIPAAAQSPQVMDLLQAMDGIARFGQAAQADAQRQAQLARQRAYQRQLQQQIAVLIAQIRAAQQPARPVQQEYDPNWAFKVAVDMGIARNQQLVQQWMGKTNHDISRILNGSPEELAEITRRYNRMAGQMQGQVYQQQVMNSINQYNARVAASNERSRAIQDADAAHTYAESVRKSARRF